MINVVIACAGSLLAVSAWNGPAAGTELVSAGASAPAAAGARAAATGQPIPAPSYARACVEALSKNICDSTYTSTGPQVDGCPLTGCRTLYVPSVQWQIPIKTNRQDCVPCSGPGECDETQDMDGVIEASVQYTMRFNGPCPFRGCFEGRWQHQTEDGTTYTGRVMGTLGVGTHRFNELCCDTSADRTCERCLDVEFIRDPDAETGTWRIGVEGTFEGFSDSGEPIPDTMHFSISGDLYAAGDVNGPYVFDSFTWRFAGTADGVHIDYCN